MGDFIALGLVAILMWAGKDQVEDNRKADKLSKAEIDRKMEAYFAERKAWKRKYGYGKHRDRDHYSGNGKRCDRDHYSMHGQTIERERRINVQQRHSLPRRERRRR